MDAAMRTRLHPEADEERGRSVVGHWVGILHDRMEFGAPRAHSPMH